MYVDVGSYGRESDGGLYDSSSFAKELRRGALHIPQAAPVAGDPTPIPYFLVGDGAFPLSESMLKPFPGHNLTMDLLVFNYRWKFC